MKVVLQRLWLEPAYLAAVVVTLGNTALQIVEWSDRVEIPLVVLLGAIGAHAVRRQTVTKRHLRD